MLVLTTPYYRYLPLPLVHLIALLHWIVVLLYIHVLMVVLPILHYLLKFLLENQLIFVHGYCFLHDMNSFLTLELNYICRFGAHNSNTIFQPKIIYFSESSNGTPPPIPPVSRSIHISTFSPFLARANNLHYFSSVIQLYQSMPSCIAFHSIWKKNLNVRPQLDSTQTLTTKPVFTVPCTTYPLKFCRI